MREHVEESRGRCRPHLREVAAPDLVGRPRPPRSRSRGDRRRGRPASAPSRARGRSRGPRPGRSSSSSRPSIQSSSMPQADGLAVASAPLRRTRPDRPRALSFQNGWSSSPAACRKRWQCSVRQTWPIPRARALSAYCATRSARELRRSERGAVGREVQVVVDEQASANRSRRECAPQPDRRALRPRPPRGTHSPNTSTSAARAGRRVPRGHVGERDAAPHATAVPARGDAPAQLARDAHGLRAEADRARVLEHQGQPAAPAGRPPRARHAARPAR